MFGLSLAETLLIVCVLLIVFGPEQLPDIARKAGRFMGQVRGQIDSVRRDFYNTVYTPAETLEQEVRDLKRELRAISKESGPLCPDYVEPDGSAQSADKAAKPALAEVSQTEASKVEGGSESSKAPSDSKEAAS